MPPNLPMAASSSKLDCLECGACCYQREGTILVESEDLANWQAKGRSDILSQLVPGHFGQLAFARGRSGACVHHGLAGQPHACAIYEDRAQVCRNFEVGSAQCLEFRRDRGLEPPGK